MNATSARVTQTPEATQTPEGAVQPKTQTPKGATNTTEVTTQAPEGAAQTPEGAAQTPEGAAQATQAKANAQVAKVLAQVALNGKPLKFEQLPPDVQEHLLAISKQTGFSPQQLIDMFNAQLAKQRGDANGALAKVVQRGLGVIGAFQQLCNGKFAKAWRELTPAEQAEMAAGIFSIKGSALASISTFIPFYKRVSPKALALLVLSGKIQASQEVLDMAISYLTNGVVLNAIGITKDNLAKYLAFFAMLSSFTGIGVPLGVAAGTVAGILTAVEAMKKALIEAALGKEVDLFRVLHEGLKQAEKAQTATPAVQEAQTATPPAVQAQTATQEVPQVVVQQDNFTPKQAEANNNAHFAPSTTNSTDSSLSSLPTDPIIANVAVAANKPTTEKETVAA